MGAKLNIAALALATMISSGAAADINQKPGLRVDFNKMIDTNNNETSELHESIDKNTNVADAKELRSKVKKNDRRKVIDFVDVEVGWGEENPPVVDRRFDSVGEPRTVDLSLMNAESGS